MKKSDLKKIIREEIKTALRENQPAPKPSPSPRPSPGPGVHPGKPGTEKPKPRRPFEPRPGVNPKPKMEDINETEQDIINKIINRYKSKK